MVEDVEVDGRKDRADALRNSGRFAKRQVEIPEAESAHRTTAGASVLAAGTGEPTERAAAVMIRGAARRPDGFLDLLPARNAAGWLVLTWVGLASAASLARFNRWLERSAA